MIVQKKILHRKQGPLRGSSSFLWSSEPAQGLNPVKLAYDPTSNTLLAHLTASAWASMPAVLVTLPTVMQNSPFLPCDHYQYSLCICTEGWPGWVGLDGWLYTKMAHPQIVTHLSDCEDLGLNMQDFINFNEDKTE